MKIAIIEDEPLLAEALQDEILHLRPNAQIVASLPSIKTALTYLAESEPPDLFFSDIELADGLSFEIFKRIKLTTPIIFCTAYNHYATEAFRVHSIDYLLKPFEREDIKNALQRYEEQAKQGNQPDFDFAALLQMMQTQNTPTERNFLIQKGSNIIPVPVAEIAVAEIKNGIVYLHTFNKKRHPINHTIEKTHQILGGNFYRVNRQFIVNRKAVGQVAQYFGRKLLVQPTIPFEERIIVSKANVTDFLKWLKN